VVVGVAADHAGVALRELVLAHLRRRGLETLDLGGSDPDSGDDYPDRAADIGEAIADGRIEAGVLVCGSGAGAAIAANKIHGVRAAVCHDSFTARQSREDDDANIICLGSRIVAPEYALELVDRFIDSQFSGLERHRRRVEKIRVLERRG